MPLGAVIARKDLMDMAAGCACVDLWRKSGGVAAALVTMKLLESELIANAETQGDYLMGRMRDWPRRFPIVGDVRGLGLMMGFEMVRDQSTKERAPELRDRIVDMAFERGLLIFGAGQNAIRLCPPLVINRDQAISR